MKPVRAKVVAQQSPLFQQKPVVIGIAASPGGIPSLLELLRRLKPEWPLCVVVVLHLDPSHKSFLAELLQRRCAIRVQEAGDRDPLQAGVVYIAPPNVHITIEDSRLHLQSTPPVRLQRPSVDVLFASMAGALGEKSVGIILSGSGKDGSEGLRLLKKAGGIT